MRWGISKYRTIVAAAVMPLLLLAGCGVNATDVDVWPRYEAFEREISRPAEARDYSAFLSARMLAEVASAGTADERRALLAQVEFPRWLGEVKSYHQVMLDDGRVCLTVNGQLPETASFGSVAVEYVREAGRFVVNDVHYQYLEGAHEFMNEGRCPTDFSLAFPS